MCLIFLVPRRVIKPFHGNDVALVTGGSRGLGHAIIQELKRHGVKHVYNLDVVRPSDEPTGVKFIQCDVGNETELKSILNRLIEILAKDDLFFTICINNAGIRHSQSLLHLPDETIKRVFNINTFSHIWTLKTLVHNHLDNVVPNHGQAQLFMTSISSVLGELGPRNLSVYSGSKAALTQIYESLRQELRDEALVQLMLVSPGQLDTQMFQDVVPTKKLLAPVIHKEKLARQIVRRIQAKQEGILCAPFYANVLPIIRILPMFMQTLFRWFTDMDNKVIDPTEKDS